MPFRFYTFIRSSLPPKDARSLAGIKATVDECLPSLQQEYEEVLRDLEREQAEVAEIDACDQDYLNDLKTSILEQK